MRNFFIVISLVSTLALKAQGFGSTAINWALPNGGKINSASTQFGFNNQFGSAITTEGAGSQTWGSIDMNGDGLIDLVVTAQLQGGNVTSFSPNTNQYWNVYLNNGSNYSSSPQQWNLPNGGKINANINLGFNALTGVATTAESTGSQSWSLADIDGDNKPDLIITAQLQGGNVTSFSPNSNQYWKVYLNTGTGFSTSPVNWNLPNGGKTTNSGTLGFNSISGVALNTESTGSQSWSLLDINGDGKLELIVTAQLQGGNVTSFSPSSNQYWKVYSNTTTGFNLTESNWSLPNGGKLLTSANLGYNNLNGTALITDVTGSQTWFLQDVNNDKSPDLFIAAQLQGGNVTSFSPTSGQYWKIYLNTGNSFALSNSNFVLPNGGKITTSGNLGFNSQAGFALISESVGSQTWFFTDLNGDGFSELIVTAQLQGGNLTSFSPTNNQYWNVYPGTSSGVSLSPVQWSLPLGGKQNTTTNFGFNSLNGTAIPTEGAGSQTWNVFDINGDNLLDLVVSAQLQGGNVTSFSPTTNQYWKVYGNSLVGIKKVNSSDYFKIFPNPAKNNLTIKVTNSNFLASLSIIDQFGKSYLEKKFEEDEKVSETNLDIANLKSGLYFLRINNIVYKLIKE